MKEYLVRKASESLDDIKPDWYKDIDLDTIDMGDCNECLLGQLFGGYTDGIRTMIGSVNPYQRQDILRAFNSDIPKELWKFEVEARRNVEKWKEEDIEAEAVPC